MDLHRFDIPGIATIVDGRGGLPMVRVTAAHASGDMYLHGAHVTSWKPGGTAAGAAGEVLFVSEQARYEDVKAIRGGVPVCFPWFGALDGRPDAPAHGCVRTKSWDLVSIAEVDEAVVVTMSTRSGLDTFRFWPSDFLLVHRVTFGAALTMELIATNTGASPLRFEAALHAYYRVADIAGVRLAGLSGVRYVDSVEGNRERVQDGDIRFTAETDRIYLDTHAPVTLFDGTRHVGVTAENAGTTVVWNPWIRRAQAFADMDDEEWRDFVCIETCNVTPRAAISLGPGEQYVMRAIVTVQQHV